MLEINKEQLLAFDNVNRARILKYIVLGLIKYTEERRTNERASDRKILKFTWI